MFSDLPGHPFKTRTCLSTDSRAEPESESLRLPMTGVTHQTRTSAGPLGAADAAVACAPSTDATPVRKREAPIAPTTLLTAPPCSIMLWTLRFASLLHSLRRAKPPPRGTGQALGTRSAGGRARSHV